MAKSTPTPARIPARQSSRAAHWNKRQGGAGVPLTLPSGAEIVARRAGLTYLLEKGMVPDPLAPIVNSMIGEALKSQTKDEAALQEVAASQVNALSPTEQLALVTSLYATTLKACGVDPKFVDEVTDPETEVAVADVDWADKEFIFNWAQGGTGAALATFRPE